MSVIDPQTWRDAEDGRALRELREALPDEWEVAIDSRSTGWVCRLYDRDEKAQVRMYGPTIAAACDACREALVSR